MKLRSSLFEWEHFCGEGQEPNGWSARHVFLKTGRRNPSPLETEMSKRVNGFVERFEASDSQDPHGLVGLSAGRFVRIVEWSERSVRLTGFASTIR